MSVKGAEQWVSNPLGKGLDQMGIDRPKLKVGDFTLDATALTSPVSAFGQVTNAATVHETKRQEKKAADEQADLAAADARQFEAFKKQEDSLLSGSSEVFTPKYKVRGDLAKQTEALAQIFNARKSEALQRRSSPGISQTRSA
jgi:hypothetical protein